jgi:hypothetical protein
MAQCVVITSGAVVESAADPCTGFLILTPAEYAAISVSPFRLTLAEGALIGGALAAIWASAWAWRQLRRMLDSGGLATERDI